MLVNMGESGRRRVYNNVLYDTHKGRRRGFKGAPHSGLGIDRQLDLGDAGFVMGTQQDIPQSKNKHHLSCCSFGIINSAKITSGRMSTDLTSS